MEEPIKKRVRKSRFDNLGDKTSEIPPIIPESLIPTIDPIARAAEISRNILNQTNITNQFQTAALQVNSQPSIQANILQASQATIQQNAIKAAELQAQLAAQIASVTNLIKNVQSQPKDKKSTYRPLLLDELGREIDEQGNLVKREATSKTLALNKAVIQAQRKKENPYLAHRQPSQAPAYVPGVTSTASAGISGLSSVLPMPAVDPVDESKVNEVIDDRLVGVIASRDRRGKKALHFAEAGKYVQQAEDIQKKEERKIIAGYASGRKGLEAARSGEGEDETKDMAVEEDAENSEDDDDSVEHIPPPVDGGVVPSLEWWDEHYLPKLLRESRRRSRAAADKDDFQALALINAKSYKYVQHPIAIKPLGGDKPDAPLPLYLTKKERKRIRKTAREEREREKRDKMMMGLLPPPEPKFKLSNFMKVLGDQAVADPSKVEMKVLQQMRQRVLNHEMRNQAAKLTPAERKQKKMRKMLEDTSRQVHVAVFRLSNFSNPKHRFKVDVNAQQHFLSGIVLLNQEEKAKCNVIIVEGGPKGVRKLTKLMLSRIPWNDKVEDRSGGHTSSSAAIGPGVLPDSHEIYSNSHGASLNTYASDDDIDQDEDDDETTEYQQGAVSKASSGAARGAGATELAYENKCALVWQGIIPKRVFTGFKFQECKNSTASRKFLETKNVAHYWDMATMSMSL